VINGFETEELCVTVKPEVKRKVIGDTFVRVAEEELRKFGLDPAHVYLAQGTLRPDLIESASHVASVGGSAEVIKTHHNDTALVRALRNSGRIIEPLRDLHKDEVRLLGLELGLPPHLIWRQPFPGPGLAVRIICARTPFETPLDESIVQALRIYCTPRIHVSLLSCRTVGVQGDSRSYSSLVSLSSMDAHPPNWHSLFHLAKEIPKRVHGVNRVVYTFGAPLRLSHYRTITPTLLSEECIHQLQLADEIVNRLLLKYDLIKALSQVPVILYPVNFQQEGEENEGKRSICIRTFITNDFMVSEEQEEWSGEECSNSIKAVSMCLRLCACAASHRLLLLFL
jgi:GMP synthase (glutamine-hydrolysing)